MSKNLRFIFIFFLITNCSLNKNSGLWTKNSEIDIEKDLIITELFKDEKILSEEFNSNVKINLKSNLTTNNFINNLSNNSGRLDYDGNLVTNDRKFIYPIVKGVPRFVGESNYADNFGMQWNHFSKTQLDSYSGQAISSDRFWKATGWISSEMKGKWILDVGCGSGRFAEVALSAGAKVVALDYSSAVDACYRNFMGHPNLYVVQGDIYELPFEKK